MSSSEGMSLREKAEAGIDSAYPHETREQWKSRIFNHLLRLVAEEVERMPKATNPHKAGSYLRYYDIDKIYDNGQKAAHTNIVTELRKEG